MINPKEFYDELKRNGVSFFTGVPDSSLKSVCAYITENTNEENHIITANEGNAISLAAGKYLATRKIPLVYMQNSGQGNAVNPLTSLADPEVYSIPLLLLIGWRGEPGIKDEPQHIKQGRITLKLLDTLEIPYEILPQNIDEAKVSIENAFVYMKNNNSSYALVVKNDTFDEYKITKKDAFEYEMTREDALKVLIDNLDDKSIIVSTTGKTSRELFEYREKLNQNHVRDLLTVGSMGHSSSIALGIALSKPEMKIYCFDGDGALIMHMGALAIIGQMKPKNFVHIVFNNGSYDSVGGQPSAGLLIDIPLIAKACKYKEIYEIKEKSDIIKTLEKIKIQDGPILIEIKIKKGSRKDLGRPKSTPQENKEKFMDFLESN